MLLRRRSVRLTVWLRRLLTVWLGGLLTVWLRRLLTVWLGGLLTVWLRRLLIVWLRLPSRGVLPRRWIGSLGAWLSLRLFFGRVGHGRHCSLFDPGRAADQSRVTSSRWDPLGAITRCR